MSTRMLGLLTTTAAISMALTGGIAAASAAPPPSPSDTGAATDANPAPNPNAAPEDPPAEEPKTPPKAKPAAKDGTDLKACEDAECEVQIKDGDEIKLDKKYGMDAIHVKTDGTRVTFTVQDGSSKMTSSMDAAWPNSTASYNGITLRPHKAKDGSMILNISHD